MKNKIALLLAPFQEKNEVTTLCELVFHFLSFFLFLFPFFCLFVSLKAQSFKHFSLEPGLGREMPEVNYRQALLGGYVISRDALSALFYSGQYGGRSRNSRGQIKVYFAPLNSVSSTRSCYISCIWCFL